LPPATGACGAHGVWTSTTTAGRGAGGNAACNGWSDPSSGNANWGSTDSLDNWSDGCSVAGADPAVACSSVAPLFCFQQ
jgi:hypothetical protein